MKHKIAIVATGGGMKCAYGAGAVVALAKELKLVNPDIVIASSGSTGTLSYYVSKQYDSIKNIWTNLLASKKFLDLSRISNMMNIDYLIDDVFKKTDPLNVKKVKNSKTTLLIGATKFRNGKSMFFSNKKDNVLEAMRVSKAVPLIFGRAVRFNGIRYIDGDIGCTLKLLVEKAHERGATKVVVINNKNLTFFGKLFWKTYAMFVNNELKKAIYNHLNEHRHRPHDAFIIEPHESLALETLDNSKEHLMKAFNAGYNDVANNKELRSFLNE